MEIIIAVAIVMAPIYVAALCVFRLCNLYSRVMIGYLPNTDPAGLRAEIHLHREELRSLAEHRTMSKKRQIVEYLLDTASMTESYNRSLKRTIISLRKDKILQSMNLRSEVGEAVADTVLDIVFDVIKRFI